MAFEPGDKIGDLSEAELLAFLAHPGNARIATITPEGWPYMTPVWYELDLDARSFLVVGREHARWVTHIRDNLRVAFHVAADEHAEPTRVLVSLTPTTWASWTGREWHPRYR
jgi:nitroimidazol reductase NimA-like FMN-containing flavoprotein (pyridoxamine 5'-phosphate oxidase superfamily)